MFYAFGGSKTLVKHTFFIMILTWDIQKHWQAPKQKNQTTRCTKHRQAPKKQKKQKVQQLLRSGPIVPGNFSFFGFFGACAGLVHLVVWFFWFFWCLCRFGDSDFTKHWQAPKKQKNQTTRCTKHRQAQKNQKHQKVQQLLRSGPIVPGNFSFFVFFGACAGLVHLVVWFFCFCWCLCRFGDSDFTKHWQAPKKQKKQLDAPNTDRHQKKQKKQKSSNYSEVDP